MNDFKYTPPKNAPVESDELLNDLEKVANNLGINILTQKIYTENGKYDVSTISRRFGTWNKALEMIQLKSGNVSYYTDVELYENILNIWQNKGKQPIRRDLSNEPSIISQGPYNRRFNSWSHALQSFIEYANEKDIENSDVKNEVSEKRNKTSRDPSLRLRFKVLKRDDFSCKQCGASPAKEKNVELHVDHIQPWSKGGETTFENLQTLCQKCNLGKSNLE